VPVLPPSPNPPALQLRPQCRPVFYATLSSPTVSVVCQPFDFPPFRSPFEAAVVSTSLRRIRPVRFFLPFYFPKSSFLPSVTPGNEKPSIIPPTFSCPSPGFSSLLLPLSSDIWLPFIFLLLIYEHTPLPIIFQACHPLSSSFSPSEIFPRVPFPVPLSYREPQYLDTSKGSPFFPAYPRRNL